MAEYEYTHGKYLAVGDEIEIAGIAYVINRVEEQSEFDARVNRRKFHVTICDDAPSRELALLTVHNDTLVKRFK